MADENGLGLDSAKFNWNSPTKSPAMKLSLLRGKKNGVWLQFVSVRMINGSQ